VTKAKDPAKFCKIKLIPRFIVDSSDSVAKSFKPISRVVIIAIVTEREITGDIISFIADSRA
jgi:hypothetical protein